VRKWKKEVISIVDDLIPFKNHKEVKAEIRTCGLVGGIIQYLGILFAILGVIAGLFNINLGLGSTSWLLLAVFFALNALIYHIHSVVAKHLYGIESENKNK